MRIAVLSAFIGAGLVWAVLSATDTTSQAYAKGENRVFNKALPSGGLIALSASGPENHQQITVIDPTRRVMSVYHIDQRSGAISLRSVRNINWDLQMLEFNSTNPTPREIRFHSQKK